MRLAEKSAWQARHGEQHKQFLSPSADGNFRMEETNINKKKREKDDAYRQTFLWSVKLSCDSCREPGVPRTTAGNPGGRTPKRAGTDVGVIKQPAIHYPRESETAEGNAPRRSRRLIVSRPAEEEEKWLTPRRDDCFRWRSRITVACTSTGPSAALVPILFSSSPR